ncbi:TadE/TadG family type IV pilus assembly protein [Parvibaculum sp.]|uniref:TadE/TadG family type IV pilus assembly protein n=1 Tax=Parvibaculum sp. TaxID=2024848 RepID=UPI002731ADD3|nr:TadE/TadG family type IV pilus assembly protein [Parvibaculum sp.]MDP1626312.1 pilus assembly protein [Parvibaculum sp.]MDP2151297.1 pilus assembly protein [Parvibaculum sp.]MDP3327138.1 pilus assembly protein [Parvibaculum sp.]
MRRFQNLFRRLWNDRSGNFAAILAISMVPIVAAVGASVDISRAYIVESRLKAALDASALAIGGSTGLSAAQMQTMAQSYFSANYPASKIGVPGTLSVTQNGNVVSLSVSADMPTSLMGVVGINTLKVAATTEVTRMGKKLEVVLVLDNTGSMNSDGRMTVLKSAAKDLITTVSSAAVSAGDVRIAIVPFTTDVNVGTSYKNSNWLKWSWELPTETCVTTGSGKNKTTTCTQDVRTVSKSSWKGCVVDRDQNYDVSIADPVTIDNATLFPANDNNLYNNNCTLRPIVPFSTDWTMLKNEIDAMVAGGATNTTIGFVWGWQMLINGKVLSNAAAKDAEKLEKVMVYLTDGDNTYYRQGIGSCNGSSYCAGVDVRTALVCSAIKGDGITVYTVRLINGNATLLRNCASSPSMYYSVNTASELTDVFKSIAQSLSNLRISK